MRAATGPVVVHERCCRESVKARRRDARLGHRHRVVMAPRRIVRSWSGMRQQQRDCSEMAREWGEWASIVRFCLPPRGAR